MKPTPAELALLRTRPQQVDTKLVIYKPPTVFACRVNDLTIQKTALSITYDTVSSGAYTDVRAGMTMYVGTAAGKADIGRARVKSATATVLSVAENGLDWADNLYLTVVNFYELWPKSSLDVQNGTSIIHYIDYDFPYNNQNQFMGTLICAGPPGVVEAGGSIYWGSSGTVQTEGMALGYFWSFGGGSPTTGTTSDPGYVQYNTPGYYMTEVTATLTGSYISDTTYRPVIVLGGSVQPYTNWGFDSIDGSRDEGGWTAKLWLREENMPEVMDGSLCIIYQDCYYGSTRQNIGGNSPNRQKILFIGYIIDNSITYRWNESKMEFAISSPTGRMKLLEGLSVSMDNVAGDPTGWQQVKNLNGKKALYYYLKWHTTVLDCCDVHWMIDPDPEISSWDSEISSVYDITQKFADTYYLGEVVSDRQGAIWIERHPKSIHLVTGTYNTVLDLDRQDWMGEVDITEQLYSPVSYLEMHGLGYAGIATGTLNDYLSAAPYINKRNPFGQADFIQGYVVSNQAENNQIVGDVFAHKNARFSSVNVKLAGWYSLFDIAPEECITLTTIQQDTVRGMVWNKKHFLMREMSIEADSKNKTLLPTVSLYEVTQGTDGATVPIPTPVQSPTYPEFPPITGGWTDIPWPFDWPKPWVEPPLGDECRGKVDAIWNGPYGLPFSLGNFTANEVRVCAFPCYVRQVNAYQLTKITLYGIVYGSGGWHDVIVEALDGSQNVIATAVCIEDHGFPGANTYGVFRFGSLTGFEVSGFRVTSPNVSGGSGYNVGSPIAYGAITVNSANGNAVGGLTVGKYYAIEAYGTWLAIAGGGDPVRGYQISNNGGSNWYGDSFNSLGAYAVPWALSRITTPSGYSRYYWQATTASILTRAADNNPPNFPEDYTDNTSLGFGYYLYEAIITTLQLQAAIIENVCL